MSPTARTLAWFRKRGYECGVTEHWVKHPGMRMGVRKDLFGFIDVVAIGDSGTIGVQATSRDNIASRVRKIEGIPAAKLWLSAGNRIVVIGWRKNAKSNRWEPRLTEAMLIGGSMQWIHTELDQ